jgi:hypothetical protein
MTRTTLNRYALDLQTFLHARERTHHTGAAERRPAGETPW